MAHSVDFGAIAGAPDKGIVLRHLAVVAQTKNFAREIVGVLSAVASGGSPIPTDM